MTRVVVTGSEGAIGPYVVTALREHAVLEIIRVSKRPSPDLSRYSIDLSQHDLPDFGAEVIIHLAATAYRPTHGMAPEAVAAHDLATLRDDIAITGHVLAGAEHCRHFVFVSSGLVYGDPFLDTEIPHTAIGLAKLVGERQVMAWARAAPGRTFTIWRPFNVVSPLEPTDRPGHFHADVFRQLFREGAAEVKATRAERTLLWVGDVATAIARFLFDDRAYRSIDLAGPHAAADWDIAQQILVYGLTSGLPSNGRIAAPPLHTPPRPPMPSMATLRERLGWHPMTTPLESLAKFVGHHAEAMRR